MVALSPRGDWRMPSDAVATTWLAERGYDEQFGARPLARLIQTSLRKALAEELLFGALKEGGHGVVGVKKGELSFKFS